MSEKAVLVETRLRKLFYKLESSLFEIMEIVFILNQVNRRVLNSIPIRYDMFIDFIGFKDLNLLQND